jgi:hypothetical protein
MRVIYAVAFAMDGEEQQLRWKVSEAAHAALEGGAQAPRLWRRTYGSFYHVPNFVFVIEFEDRAAMADCTSRMDPVGGLGHVYSRVVASELPLPPGRGELTGSVVEVELTRPVPGRWRDAMQASQNAAAFHLLAGAVECRLWHVDIGGPHSRHLVFCAQYADLHSWAAGRDDAIRHPDTRAKAALMLSGDPPHLELRSDLFSAVALDAP